jgi:uncharacterized membrane protein
MIAKIQEYGLLPYAKTLTYCLMHFTVAISVAYALTGSWKIALGIGIIEPLVQTVTYHFHERAWGRATRRTVPSALPSLEMARV